MPRAIRVFPDDLKYRRGLSPNTVSSYESDLIQFQVFLEDELGSSKPSSVDVLAIRSFLAHLHGRGIARASIARKLAALRTFFRFLLREGTIRKNPARLGSTPGAGRRHRRALLEPPWGTAHGAERSQADGPILEAHSTSLGPIPP